VVNLLKAFLESHQKLGQDLLSGQKRLEVAMAENNQIQNRNIEKMLKEVLNDPRGQIGGQNPDDNAEFDDGNENDLRYRFREVIKTRVVYQSSTFFSYVLESLGILPSNNFIADGAVYVIQKAGFLPCRISIFAGLILRKYDPENKYFYYRYYHPSYNTRIGEVLSIHNHTKSMKNKLLANISQDDYASRFKHHPDNLGSGWNFVSVVNLMYHVNKIL
ncbi:MAG: hypothetical protein GY931_20360, partial [Maribacter sp.]|nr:hypothetical protein [Maribacter sp.]